MPLSATRIFLNATKVVLASGSKLIFLQNI